MDQRTKESKELPTKRIVIITSAGRTGTAFFGNRLSTVIEDSFSTHEPDVYKFHTEKITPKIRTFGFKHLFINRFFKDFGVRQISERNLKSNEVKQEDLEAIKKLRLKYYSDIDQSLIIESYHAWYGLIEELHATFENVKVISVVRDPREWIRSNVNFNSYFGKRDLSTTLGFQRLNPMLINDEKYIDRWEKFTWLEKLAWVWMTIYSEIHRQSNSGNTKVYKYEDIFLANDQNVLTNLLDEVTIWPEKAYSYDLPEDFLTKKVNANKSYTFPKWDEWGKDDKDRVLAICGDLMKEFGYDR